MTVSTHDSHGAHESLSATRVSEMEIMAGIHEWVSKASKAPHSPGGTECHSRSNQPVLETPANRRQRSLNARAPICLYDARDQDSPCSGVYRVIIPA